MVPGTQEGLNQMAVVSSVAELTDTGRDNHIQWLCSSEGSRRCYGRPEWGRADCQEGGGTELGLEGGVSLPSQR